MNMEMNRVRILTAKFIAQKYSSDFYITVARLIHLIIQPSINPQVVKKKKNPKHFIALCKSLII